MTTWAIGDVQGCYDSLAALLHKVGYDPDADRLWLCGDLVNRGPKSLETLRWASAQGDRLVTVLGNHDLHLLARHAGVRGPKSLDTLDAVLGAPDADALVDWLRTRPFLHRDSPGVLVHAGLHPHWTITQAEDLAAELADALRGPDWRAAIATLFEHKAPWSPDLRGAARRAAAASVFTTIRACAPDGTPDRTFNGEVADLPRGLVPWFDVPGRASAGVRVVFGHWAALGLVRRPDLLALDTGCVWGDRLTAADLESDRVVQQAAREPRRPRE